MRSIASAVTLLRISLLLIPIVLPTVSFPTVSFAQSSTYTKTNIAGDVSQAGLVDGIGSDARFSSPAGLWGDGIYLYVADKGNSRVRRITLATAEVVTIATVPRPLGIWGDGNTLYVTAYDEIRKIDLQTRTVTVVAGMSGLIGIGSADGVGTAAKFSEPSGLWGDATDLYVTDTTNQTIRKITRDTATVTTFAGRARDSAPSIQGSVDGIGENARFGIPTGIWGDGTNLYVADAGVRKIGIQSRQVTTISVGGSASAQVIQAIWGGMGNIYFANSSTVSRLSLASGEQRAIVGELGFPQGIWGDGVSLYVTQYGGNSILKLTPTEPVGLPYAISSYGATSLSSASEPEGLTTGYATVESLGGTQGPDGFAVFGLRQNDVLVTEAAVPAVPLTTSGMIYADVGGNVNTGLAIANPNVVPAFVSFFWTDAEGNDVSAGAHGADVPAGGQISAFLDQAPFNLRAPFSGTLKFVSGESIAAVGLRGYTNERGEFLVTTMPVASVQPAAQASILPHFADGAGWTTQLVLVNPTKVPIAGTAQFRNQSGQPVALTLNGQTDSSIGYYVPPQSAVKVSSADTGQPLRVGSLLILPSGGSSAPAAFSIFSYRVNGVTVAEAGIPLSPAANEARVYAEVSGAIGSAGSIQTGIAVANPSDAPVDVRLELVAMDGTPTGLSAALSVQGNGQIATFLESLPGFGAMPRPFQGILRVSTEAPSGMSVLGLRGRYNERGDFLMASTPPVRSDGSSRTTMVFPHFAMGAGWATQFILLSNSSSPQSGVMTFFDKEGRQMTLLR